MTRNAQLAYMSRRFETPLTSATTAGGEGRTPEQGRGGNGAQEGGRFGGFFLGEEAGRSTHPSNSRCDGPMAIKLAAKSGASWAFLGPYGPFAGRGCDGSGYWSSAAKI